MTVFRTGGMKRSKHLPQYQYFAFGDWKVEALTQIVVNIHTIMTQISFQGVFPYDGWEIVILVAHLWENYDESR